jgi:hypothetical protein
VLVETVHNEKIRAAIAVVIETCHVITLSLACLRDANRSQVSTTVLVEEQPIRPIMVGSAGLNDVEVVEAVAVHPAAGDLPAAMETMHNAGMSEGVVAPLR